MERGNYDNMASHMASQHGMPLKSPFPPAHTALIRLHNNLKEQKHIQLAPKHPLRWLQVGLSEKSIP